MGGLALGIERKTATEFSFCLAITTMFGAAAYDIYKGRSDLSIDDGTVISTGMIVFFLVALIVVRWLVNFVSHHGFAMFGWYRIITGTVVLWILFLN